MPYDSTDFIVTTLPAPTIHPSVRKPEAIKKLRDHIAKHPDDFDMRSPQPHECGTPVCFYGHAKALFFRTRLFRTRFLTMLRSNVTTQQSADALGLSPQQAATMFMMRVGDCYPMLPSNCQVSAASATQGIALLDHYLATGEIDWAAVL